MKITLGVLLVLGLAIVASAQTAVSDFDGLTPVGLQPGAPAGSYALSGLDTVNLYNGSLNVTIPLLNIGGRGEAGYTMVAKYDARWDATGLMSEVSPCWSASPCPLWTFQTSGWANWDYLYRPAGITVRQLNQGTTPVYSSGVFQCYVHTETLVRIMVGLADGTELTLVDAASGGAPAGLNTPFNCSPQSFDRGTTFIATDGSATTFIADNHIYDTTGAGTPVGIVPTGTLFFRDGRKFHFGAYVVDGYTRVVVDRIQDRNGNRTTFNYNLTLPGFQYAFSITDPVGRITTVGVGKQYTFDDPSAGCSGCIGRYDEIEYDGISGSQRTITVYRRPYWYDRVASLQGPPPNYQVLFGGYAASTVSPFDWAISKIVLPDGHAYQFRYNQYAEVARLDLPTGGHYEFDWVNGPGVNPYDVCPANPESRCPVIRAPSSQQPSGYELLTSVYRRLGERREYVDAGSSWTRRTVYSVMEDNANVSGDPLGRCGFIGNANFESGYCNQVSVYEYDPPGGLLSTTIHYFYGAVSRPQSLFPQQGWYSWWLEGREFRTDVIQPGGPTLSKQIQTWQNRRSPAWWTPQFGGPLPAVDARIGGSDVVVDNGKMARKLFTYPTLLSDNTNHIVDLWEYDYGPGGAQGPLLRRTHTDFASSINSPETGVHLRDLQSSQVIYDGVGNLIAQAEHYYDETPPAAAPGIRQNVPVAPQRGNVSRIRRWRNTDNLWFQTSNTYDVGGNVTGTTDPAGKLTSYTYTDCSGAYAYVTAVNEPLGHSTTFGHNCTLGKVTSITDRAGFTTTVQYGNSGNDVLDRISKVIHPNGQQTGYSYSSDLTMVTTKSDQTNVGDQVLVSAGASDGLGRSVESRLYTGPTTFISTKKAVDAFGRTKKAYNPGSTTDGPTYMYDALGRVRTATYADGSQDSFQWTGDEVLGTDAAGKQTKRQVDALGRTVVVTEDPNSQNLVTSYAYDALDNLTSVIQGAQTRSFSYDSLGLLRAVRNPEVGSVVACLGQSYSECYTYDAAGNLARKDAFAAQTDFEYDALDRLKTKKYNGTPTVTYSYDVLQRGCLDSVTNPVATMTFTTYGPNCTPTGSRQSTGGQIYNFSYNYNLASALTSETYPSGRSVTYEYDAAGRPNRVGKNPTSSYASLIAYTPHGALSSVKLGVTSSNSGWWESWQYNNRLQPASVDVGSGILNLAFSYCPGGSATCLTNNGNMQRQVIARSGTTWTQNYTGYDAMNRLTAAQETGPGSWSENYGYDRHGNRWLDTYSGLPAPTNEVPRNQNWYLSNNRIAGWTYDERGNLKSIQNMSRNFTYDWENRQITSNINGANTTYSYDGEGRRIKKTSGVYATTYVYDAFGRLIAEYSNQTSPSGTQYRNVDHLGSTRLITDSNGTPVQCHDFLPFGQELVAGIAGRSSCFPSSPAGGMEFTGKEHDAETGLDYFGARYLSVSQARFMSTDPIRISADKSNPQSWNAYVYTFNNPLKYVDPTGQWPTAIHAAILNGAFSMASSVERSALRSGSLTVDFSIAGQMLSQRAHQHGMRSPNQTAEEAETLKDMFVFDHELAAIDATAEAGYVNALALEQFGKAMHPLMDATSPAHSDKVYGGIPSSPTMGALGLILDAIGMYKHRKDESKITIELYHKNIDIVRAEYLKTFGQKAFFKATQCTQVESCPYDDSQLSEDLRMR